MRRKKSVISLGILALVLVLGVGYAVVSSVDLTIGGTASVKDADLQVDFESVAVNEGIAATVQNTLEAHQTQDTFTISNMTLGEDVVLTYTVKNHETDVSASLQESIALSNDNEEYFYANYSITEPNLAANAETTIVVTVRLIKTPVLEEDNSANISVTIKASPVDNGTI